METKGLDYSQYVCKESLAQQAGYALAVKGPHAAIPTIDHVDFIILVRR